MDILIVENDLEVSRSIATAWPDRSSTIKFVRTFSQSIPFTHNSSVDQFDAVIASAELPDGCAMELLREVRRHSAVPFVLISDRGNADSRSDAMDCGADDYVMKPFVVRELYSRVKRHVDVRRSMPPTPPIVSFMIGDVECHMQNMRLTYKGTSMALTALEAQVLEMLWTQRNRGVSKAQLYREALRRPISPDDRTLDVYVCRLRNKLKCLKNGSENYIHTVRGLGYRLAEAM